MPVTKAHIKASNKYNTKAYYRPPVCLKREYEQALRDKAEAEGKTVSAYIQDLIIKDITNDKKGQKKG